MAQILLVEDDAAASELIQQYTEVLCGKHQLTIGYCVTLVPMNTQLPRQLFYYPVLWQANYA